MDKIESQGWSTVTLAGQFIEILRINQDAFEAGRYDLAYQALAVLLFCASHERNLHYCSLVGDLARVQGHNTMPPTTFTPLLLIKRKA